MRVVYRACFGVGAQPRQLLIALLALDNHIAGPLEIAMVDLNIAGQQDAGAARGPARIQRHMFVGGAVLLIRQPFRHGRLANAVFNFSAAWQLQRRFNIH